MERIQHGNNWNTIYFVLNIILLLRREKKCFKRYSLFIISCVYVLLAFKVHTSARKSDTNNKLRNIRQPIYTVDYTGDHTAVISPSGLAARQICDFNILPLWIRSHVHAFLFWEVKQTIACPIERKSLCLWWLLLVLLLCLLREIFIVDVQNKNLK